MKTISTLILLLFNISIGLKAQWINSFISTFFTREYRVLSGLSKKALIEMFSPCVTLCNTL